MSIEEKKEPTNDSGKKEKKPKRKRTLLQKIVNVFLYIGIGFLILFLIFLGISQTSMFREYVRTTVIEQANKALNGTVYIEKIEGTIFTSLILRNAVINMESDTLLHAQKIELKTSPLQLLLKKIYVRSFEIDDASISLKKDKDGVLNISKLIPPSENPDTTKSEFPFNIQVQNLSLKDIDFSIQSFDKLNSTAVYQNINTNDLRVDNINLSISAFANINEDHFEVAINKFYAEPNLKTFKLNNLSGDFYIDKDKISINDFNLETNLTNINIDAELKEHHFFDDSSSDGFWSAPLKVKLNAHKFNFDDLSSFIKPTEILKGNVKTILNASGNLKKLNISSLVVDYLNTHLEMIGTVRNINNANNLYINADLKNSYVNEPDADKLLPSIGIPVYKNLGVVKFDTLLYDGEPLNFKTSFLASVNKGSIHATGILDLRKKLMEYDLSGGTTALNLDPVMNIQSNLNSKFAIKGKGVAPIDLQANISFSANNSQILGNSFNSISMNVTAKEKIINYKTKISKDTSNLTLSGKLNFLDENNPSYDFNGFAQNINLQDYTGDSTLASSLNFNIDADGENFDIEKMNLFLMLTLTQSKINGKNIPDSTRAILDIRKNEDGKHIINFISDLADITLQGNFSLKNAISILTYESKLLTKLIKEKTDKIFQTESLSENKNQNAAVQSQNDFSTEDIIPIDSAFSMQYNIEFKDFALLSLLIGNNQLEIDGYVNGEIKNDNNNLSIALNTEMKYLKFWGEDNVFFLSNLDVDFNVENNFTAKSLSDISAGINLKTDRVFMGSDIYDLKVDLNLKNDFAKIKFSSTLEDYLKAAFQGSFDLSQNSLSLELDSLSALYNNYKLVNKNKIQIEYANDHINFKNFTLLSKDGDLSIVGSIVRNGEQNLNISLDNIRGKNLSTSIFEMRKENSLGAKIDLDANITGEFNSPIIDVNINVDSVTFKGTNFGLLKGNLNYRNQNLETNIKFINPNLIEKDSQTKSDSVALLIKGNMPVDLGFSSVKERLLKSKPINISLNAVNFNLGTFGDMLPMVKHLRGMLNANVTFGGTFDNITQSGKIDLSNSGFFFSRNNLEYNTALHLTMDQKDITINNFMIENSSGTKQGGRMNGSGTAVLDNFKISSLDIQVNGDLKVLSQASKSASPTVYGDLVIGTNGSIEFTLNDKGKLLKAPITIKNANLTFTPSQSAYSGSSSRFKYEYIVNPIDTLNKEVDFETLVEMSRERNQDKTNGPSTSSLFDYSIDVSVENEATIIFVLSKEVNQNLTAILSGNFLYENIGNRTNAQGELKLLDGSTLEFIKTLQATGTIKFESELSNPYIDIVATYSSYYSGNSASTNTTVSGSTNASLTTSGEDIPVEVRIKIKGFLNDLNKSLTQNENNISVYVGSDNIKNNQADQSKDASQALTFLIANNFRTEEIGAGSGTNITTELAASLSGSILSGFLNRQLGDLVKSVELRQAGKDTKFALSGQAGKFKYTIGGSNTMQDLGQADVQIVYPFSRSFLIRLERKQSVVEQQSNTTEMINELGLKYIFEF